MRYYAGAGITQWYSAG